MSSLFSDNQWSQVASKTQLKKVVSLASEYYGVKTPPEKDKKESKESKLNLLKMKGESADDMDKISTFLFKQYVKSGADGGVSVMKEK